MNLFIKCTIAVIIMIAIHYISKTRGFYIAGLVLSFPGLSIIAYSFMYMEHGIAKVRLTTHFAMLSAIPFVSFLFVLNYTLKKNNIFLSMLAASTVWIILSSILVVSWNKASHL